MELTFLALEESDRGDVFFLPIPYEGTVSYLPGTRFGPEALLRASGQVETWDWELKEDFSAKVPFQTLSPLEPVASGPKEMMDSIYSRAQALLEKGGFLFSIGGEHSISFPLIKAHREKWENLAVVQIDAHSDLRWEYHGTPHSHASVMRRVVEEGMKVYQFGIRSVCEEEHRFIEESPLVTTYFSPQVLENSHREIEEIIEGLPDEIYLTIDVDGLDPSIIPGTGTPEPGGLTWYKTLFFLKTLAQKKKIVGCDMVELAPLPGSQISEFACAKLAYKIISYIFYYRQA